MGYPFLTLFTIEDLVRPIQVGLLALGSSYSPYLPSGLLYFSPGLVVPMGFRPRLQRRVRSRFARDSLPLDLHGSRGALNGYNFVKRMYRILIQKESQVESEVGKFSGFLSWVQ